MCKLWRIEAALLAKRSLGGHPNASIKAFLIAFMRLTGVAVPDRPKQGSISSGSLGPYQCVQDKRGCHSAPASLVRRLLRRVIPGVAAGRFARSIYFSLGNRKSNFIFVEAKVSEFQDAKSGMRIDLVTMLACGLNAAPGVEP